MFSEDFAEPLDSISPQLLNCIEDITSCVEGVGLGTDQLLSPAPVLANEPSRLEYRHVLLHRGHAHVVVSGERRNREVAGGGSHHDVTPRGISQSAEQPIYFLVTELGIYNHLVVDKHFGGIRSSGFEGSLLVDLRSQ